MKIATIISGMIILGFGGFSINQSAPNTMTKVSIDGDGKPTVFIIKDYPDYFEELGDTYSTLLLTTFDDDMDAAFNTWVHVIQSFESYAKTKNVDLDGVKIWLKVFWGENGTIDYIAYDFKPNTKQVDVKLMNATLESFRRNYKSNIMAKSKFSHYASATYPARPSAVYSN